MRIRILLLAKGESERDLNKILVVALSMSQPPIDNNEKHIQVKNI